MCNLAPFLLAASLALSNPCALAQQRNTTPPLGERYALLVGVNDYLEPSNKDNWIKPLQGPGNDVSIVHDLLVKPYQFTNDEAHILSLIGPKATHQGIEQAFKTQLIENARKHPGALVVFYFSGHGAQARLDDHTSAYHVTLLAYDSRADIKPGDSHRGHDISDDELAQWLEELRAVTNNIVIILDSCHSGDAIKDVDLVAKEAPPNPNGASLPANGKTDGDTTTQVSLQDLSRRHQFALLSSSTADDVSYEDRIRDLPKAPYHGLFTYLLCQTLQMQPSLTYGQVASEILLGLQHMRRVQYPVPSGNVDGKVFAGAGATSDPYIAIVSKETAQKFTIKAGKNFALDKGTFLALYDAAAERLSGEDHKIANARVIEPGDITSTVELSDAPKSPITLDDKVAIVTPFFGLGPMPFLLSNLPAEQTTDEDGLVLGQVRTLVADNKLFRIAESKDTWKLAIRRGCLVNNKLVLAGDVATNSCMPVYYLTDTENSPLLGFYVATSDPKAAEYIASKAELFVKQQNLRGLNNAVASKVKVRIEMVKGDVVNNQFVPDFAGATIATQELAFQQNFVLRVTNENPQVDAWVAVFVLTSSGKIQLMTSNPRGLLIHGGDNVMIPQQPWQIGPPEGLETYKALASTSSDINYAVFEQGGAKSPSSSPFEWVLNQLGNAHERDPEANKDLSLSDWATASVDVLVRSKLTDK
jgi:Caspase domain